MSSLGGIETETGEMFLRWEQGSVPGLCSVEGRDFSVPEKVVAVKDFQRPADVKSLQTFLWLFRITDVSFMH